MKSKLTPRKLNKSLDERLLQPDHLIDALNVAIRTSPDGQAGVVKNVEANIASEFIGVTNSFFAGFNVVIGSVSDDSVGVVYLFVYNSKDKHSVWAYSTETKTYRLIFTDPLLNFKVNGFVSADLVKIKRAIADIGLPDSEYDTDLDIVDTGFDDAFTEDENILGCTNPTAYNFNPDATQDDGSCILPDLVTVPFVMGVDFSTLVNHIYGPTSGSVTFANAFTASVSLTSEVSGGTFYDVAQNQDPFFTDGDLLDVLNNAIEQISCSFVFLDSNNNPVSFQGAANEIQSEGTFDSNSTLNSRDLGFQFISTDSISVDRQILTQTKKVKAKLKVTFSDSICASLDIFYGLISGVSSDNMWAPTLNESLPSNAAERKEFEWLVPVYDASEFNGPQNLLQFLEDSDKHLLTNAVGFKEIDGIRAGSRSPKTCLTSSMDDGQLTFLQGDALSEDFQSIPILLFPGFGFGCDTPHVRVRWRNQTTNAGERKIPIKVNLDFTDSSEWQNFKEIFEETEIIVGGDDDAAGARGPGDDEPMYIFACSNFNDPIYQQHGYDVFGSVSGVIDAIGGTNHQAYISANGNPPDNFDTSLLVSSTGLSQNGTDLGSPGSGVTGAGNPNSNYYFFPRQSSVIVNNVNDAYRPNVIFASAEPTPAGFETRALAKNSTNFNRERIKDLFGFTGVVDQYIENRVQANGTYSFSVDGFVSGLGTLQVYNALAFSVRDVENEPINEQSGFYEFESPQNPENVPLSVQDSSVQSILSTYSDSTLGIFSGGIGSGLARTFTDTLPGGTYVNNVDYLYRLFYVNARLYIHALDNTDDPSLVLTFTPGGSPNFKYQIADPSSIDLRTVDGVIPEEILPPDIEDDATSTSDESDGGLATTSTEGTTNLSTPEVATPTPSTSYKKKATKKYGY